MRIGAARMAFAGMVNLGGACDGGTGRRIVDDGLEHGGHFVGGEVALAFDDFVAVRVEDDGGGPAEIFVAGGQIGARILVGFHHDVTALQKFYDGGIAVGVGVHDVTPMAPDGFEIEQDESIFAFGVGESLVGPRLPIQMRLGRGGFLGQRGSGT